MRYHIVRRGLIAGAMVGVLAGCSSAPELGPVFNDEGARQITCRVHQDDGPGARYTDRQFRDSAQVLGLMRYYTAHGTKPYCDGAPPSETDRSWGQIYRDLGGAPDKVADPAP